MIRLSGPEQVVRVLSSKESCRGPFNSTTEKMLDFARQSSLAAKGVSKMERMKVRVGNLDGSTPYEEIKWDNDRIFG